MVPFDDLIKSISLSSVKIYDFRKHDCYYIDETEKKITKILYKFQCENTNMELNYIRDLVDSLYIKKTFDSV